MSPAAATRRDVTRLGLWLLLLSVPVVAFPDVVARATALSGTVATGNSWFVRGPFLLLYLAVPAVALSASVLVMAPGLLLTIRSELAAPERLFRAFALSLGLVSVFSGIAQSFVAEPLQGRVYALLLVALSAAVWGLAWRSAPVQRRSIPRPAAGSGNKGEVALLIGLAIVGLYALLPKLLFESFNGDGAHAFESSRLLLRQGMPFWPESAGAVAGFPGVTSMLFAFPNAWFLRLFGEVEFAVRLPFLLYLPVLGAGILTLARVGRENDGLDALTVLAVVAALACYAVSMAFSATYSPYSADIALPATQDTLLMIAWLGVVIASLRVEYGWLSWFVALTYISLPSGIILVGFWLVARLLVERPRPWPQVAACGGILLACMAGAALLPGLLFMSGLPQPGGEYGLAGVLRYFAFLQLTDASRLLYVLIPAGLFPWLALVAWRAQDTVARALTLVSIAYFLFFFVQAQVSLHHFVPAMIVPIVIAARTSAGQPLAGVSWLVMAAVAFVMALPQRAAVHLTGRTVGATIVERAGDYADSDPAVLRASTLLDRVVPYDWNPAVPASSYGGSPLVWNRYAVHGGEPTAATNYILQPFHEALPAGWQLVAWESGGASLLMRSPSVLDAQLALRPPTPAGSRWLAVPRATLFRSVAEHEGDRSISTIGLLENIGIDVGPWLDRLGVERPARP